MRLPVFSWILLFSFVVGIFLESVGSITGQCLNNQRELLIQLKNSLTFSPSASTKLVSWVPSSDCSDWVGTAWDSSGHLMGLDLSGEMISGGLGNSPLFSLQRLKSLNLADNGFNYTEIPPGLGNLTNLSYLNLSNAEFAGQIPIEISRMNNLVSLDFSTVDLFGTPLLTLENPNLERLLRNLTELKELYLDGVSISAHDWSMAVSSSSLNLEVLSLSNCNLSGPIDSPLSRLKSLSAICLSQNNLSTPVPNFLASFTNLKSLRLSSCSLIGRFPTEILQVPTLQTLELDENEQLQGFLPEFPQNGSLQTLVLSNTNFSGRLPDSIGQLKNLTRIELKGCNFSGTIPGSIGNLSQLVSLDFSSNRFNGTIPLLHMSKNLTHIDLSSNDLRGQINLTRWESLEKLVSINLQNNSLGGTIPPSLLALPLLRMIQLSNNRFDGRIIDFPNPASSLLNTLDLSSNKLNGSIPMSVFELKRVNILSLSSNNFSGHMSFDAIGGLTNLSNLDLSHNSLSIDVREGNSTPSSFPQIGTLRLASCNLRAFPDHLKGQSGLLALDLSSNKITGEIPSWIWELGDGDLQRLNLSRNLLVGLQGPYSIPSNLIVLDLSSNHLQGEIPFPPQFATYVDYSSNRFNSSIPAKIGDSLSYLVFFSLSNNSLNGPVPESICNASSLEVLDLSNNALSGLIPSCLIEGSATLRVLNLRRNKFEQIGPTTETFQGGCGLKTLDLNGNLLQGKVSKSLVDCTMLEVLNLGNNNLTDTFPCWLKDVQSLRVLVLRSNRFYGNLRCGGRNQSWPNLQIIDLASNNFSGNLSSQCFKSWEAMKSNGDEALSNLSHLQFEVLYLNRVYYQDAVTITIKGMAMELLKILTVFTSIDLSCNNFHGPIPEAVGSLGLLYVLNLSSNHLTGTIPSSLADLRHIESLDLSRNELSGEIPMQLTSLTFLSSLNLSFNRLVGKIPQGNQFHTFGNNSFLGNEGLCRLASNNTCQDHPEVQPQYLPNLEEEGSDFGTEFDWQFIITGVGFGAGAGMIIMPLIFWKKGRKWFNRNTKKCLSMIFPSIRPFYVSYENAKVAPEESTDAGLTGITGDFNNGYGEDMDDDETESETFRGRFCVFCSKLDISRKYVTHNLECRCYDSFPFSFSSSL